MTVRVWGPRPRLIRNSARSSIARAELVNEMKGVGSQAVLLRWVARLWDRSLAVSMRWRGARESMRFCESSGLPELWSQMRRRGLSKVGEVGDRHGCFTSSEEVNMYLFLGCKRDRVVLVVSGASSVVEVQLMMGGD